MGLCLNVANPTLGLHLFPFFTLSLDEICASHFPAAGALLNVSFKTFYTLVPIHSQSRLLLLPVEDDLDYFKKRWLYYCWKLKIFRLISRASEISRLLINLGNVLLGENADSSARTFLIISIDLKVTHGDGYLLWLFYMCIRIQKESFRKIYLVW